MSGGTGVNASIAPAGAARAAGGGAGARSGMTGRGRATAPVPPFHGREMSMARTWPLRSFLELGAYPEAVTSARLHSRLILWEWELSHDRGAELVVSEFVTNSVQASRLLPGVSVVKLWLFSDRRQLLVMVWDASLHPPVPADPDPELVQEGGRGLMLVEAMSDQWSWYFMQETGGKVTWALFRDAGVRHGA
jgi:anti-sigma regulatory factor (Ser/Thr protein kinase)